MRHHADILRAGAIHRLRNTNPELHEGIEVFRAIRHEQKALVGIGDLGPIIIGHELVVLHGRLSEQRAAEEIVLHETTVMQHPLITLAVRALRAAGGKAEA